MRDTTNSHKTSITEENLKIVDELVQLEEENIARGLNAEQKERWQLLTQRLFGMGSGHERRRFFRVQTQRSAHILSDGQELDADVTSLSAGGLFLRTEQVSPEMIGRDLDVAVSFPQIGEQSVSFKVQVCWVAPPEMSGSPGLGVKFVGLDKSQRRLIMEHLRTHLTGLLQLSREKYSFFFQQSSDVALLIGSQGEIVEISAATEAFLGRPASEITSVEHLIQGDDLKSFRTAMEESDQANGVRLRLHLLGQDQQPIPVQAKLTPFHIQDLVVGTMFVAQDLREQIRLEMKQRSMERRLLQADKLATIGQITAGIAHDINNPLAYVLTNLSLLEKYADPLNRLIRDMLAAGPTAAVVSPELLQSLDADLQDIITECLEGCRRIRDILLDIRAYSRMDSQTEVEIDINQALYTAIRLVKNMINHRARIECDFAKELPSTYLNFGKLIQIFLNLLTNAAQSFSDADRQRNVIRLVTTRAGDGIEISCCDNGRGIPAALKDQIFEPFFTTRYEEGGTGLGLEIVKESMSALGGSIQLKSDENEGTCFTLTLPIRERPPQPAPSWPSSTEAARYAVLIIDDEAIFLRSMDRILSQRFEIITASSPVAALGFLASRRFDAILCDVMMPEMSGLVFYDKVMLQDPTLARKIIFITGGTYHEEEQELLNTLKNLVLAKPIDMDHLIAMLSATARGDALGLG